MTKQEVTTHPVFLRLVDRQQIFIRELMENGNDKIAAAHKSWNCKDDASAEAMANKAMRKPAIRFLTDEYFGVSITRRIPSRDEVAAFAWERAQKAGDGNEAHKWAAMVNSVMGYNAKPQAEAPPPAPADAPNADEDELMAELEKRTSDTRASETEVQERSVLPV